MRQVIASQCSIAVFRQSSPAYVAPTLKRVRRGVVIPGDSAARVLMDVPLSGSTAGTVSKSQAGSYSVLAEVLRARAGSYAVLNSVQRSQAGSYTVNEAGVVLRSQSGSYQVLAYVQRSRSGSYTVSAPDDGSDATVSKSYTLKSPGRRLVMTMSTITNPGFSDKDPWERIPIGFDFSRDLAELETALADSPAPVVTIVHQAGPEDADPSAMLDSTPWISGGVVKQWVDDGTVGTRYVIRCEAYSASGARLVMSGTMTVRTK